MEGGGDLRRVTLGPQGALTGPQGDGCLCPLRLPYHLLPHAHSLSRHSRRSQKVLLECGMATPGALGISQGGAGWSVGVPESRDGMALLQ